MQQIFTTHQPHPASRPAAPAALPKVELEIVRGRARNKLRGVTVPAFLIGSAADCDLVLGDPQFSQVHAYLRVEPEGVTLRHLGFNPEVTVNGDAVTRRLLADGDRIRTGPYEFVVHMPPVTADEHEEDDNSWRLTASGAEDRVEDEIGCEQVRALLSDIRDALRPTGSRLRLYAEPEAEAPPARPTPSRAGAAVAPRQASGQ